MDSEKLEKVRRAILAQHTISWTPTDDDVTALDNAIRTAYRRLCDYAGGGKLEMDNPDYLDLCCNAAWYIRESRWPEFVSGYAEDLQHLRWKEAFGIGIHET